MWRGDSLIGTVTAWEEETQNGDGGLHWWESLGNLWLSERRGPFKPQWAERGRLLGRDANFSRYK